MTLINIWISILLWLAGPSAKLPVQSPPLNVIIILTDDQGYQDVGCFGATDIATPHLDTLAAQGVKMTSYYSPQAVCSASRAGLLTGCYPNRIGIHQAFMPNYKSGIQQKETTIAEMLKEQGYATAIYGKWHLGDKFDHLPLQHGFDEYFGIPYSNDMWPHHPQQGPIFNFGPLPLMEGNNAIDTLDDQSMLTTQITERSVDFINRKKDHPFFLYVAHPQPHVPLFVSDKFKGKSDRGLYGDVIMEIDWSVGQIRQALENNGLSENTLIIFTSDNGPWLAYGNHSGSAKPYREGKGTTWEGGQRVPFIAWCPKHIKPAQTINVPMMGIDILPTIATATNATLPDTVLDGKSGWDLLCGKANTAPQQTYYFVYHVNELQAIRHGDWKMYLPHKYRSMNGQKAGLDGLPGKYTHFTLADYELYNLKEDEEEKYNVAERHPEIVQSIKQLIASAPGIE